MKKLFLTVLLLATLWGSSYAQLNIGLKLSGTANNFLFTNSGNIKYEQNYYADTDLLGIGGGLMAKYKLNNRFSIQSELIFDAANVRFVEWVYYFNGNGDRHLSGNEFSVKMQYLETPLSGKISFGGKVTFDIIAGGFTAYLLRAKQSTHSGQLYLPEDELNHPWPKMIDYPPHDVRADYTAFNAGILAGLGITIRNALVFELRLKKGLVNINKADDGKIHTIQAQFTVGYYIFRQKKKL